VWRNNRSELTAGTSEELHGVGESRRQLRKIRKKFDITAEMGLRLGRRTQVIMQL
jgi:hypothetical protein